MFEKILIANRGEIAMRIICACKELGIRTVAVYSEADRHSLHTRFADEAICIGPAKSARSYLDIPAVISAAEITNADAVHPGYGFLSENADFAEVCETSGHDSSDPTPEVIRRMGSSKARAVMARSRGADSARVAGNLNSLEEALEIAEKIGYPVMLKASAGGGGRGMRIVRQRRRHAASVRAGASRSAAAFSCGDMYMEKLVENPRHIEFQVLADARPRRDSRRARVLHPEAASEADRGIAFAAVTKELRARISDLCASRLKRSDIPTRAPSNF